MRLRILISTLTWLILLAISIWLFDWALHPNCAENIGLASVVQLERDPQGHYRVAIQQSLAQRLHLQSTSPIQASTANGVSIGYAVRLESVRLGGIQANNVSAVIVPDLGDEVLLGMSFLGQMDIRLYQGTMTIRR